MPSGREEDWGVAPSCREGRRLLVAVVVVVMVVVVMVEKTGF